MPRCPERVVIFDNDLSNQVKAINKTTSHDRLMHSVGTGADS